MKKEQFFQKMDDGIEIYVIRWIPENRAIKGIIQLSHGMIEHSLRYEEFAKAATDAGFIFNAHDHRGHGQTAERAIEQGTGNFGIIDSFPRVVSDLDEVILKCQHDYPNVPTVLLSHSFGSFVAQSYIEKYASHINACILCGTRGPNKIEVLSGQIMSHFFCALFGRKYISIILHNLIFGSSNKKIHTPKTKSDWLTRDSGSIEKYLNDKWCTFTPTSGFFCDMLDGLSEIHAQKAIDAIPKSLPIFLISGDADPIGSYGKTVKKLYELYKKTGLENVSLKLYPDARHELLNEINKAEVTSDIIEWIGENLQK